MAAAGHPEKEPFVKQPLWLAISRDRAPCFSGPLAGTVELGRIDPSRGGAERLFVPSPGAGVVRLPIADATQSEISRRQMQIVPLDGARVRLTNLSATLAVPCGDGTLAPGGSADHPLPVEVVIGRVTMVIAGAPPAEVPAGEATPVASPPTATLSTILADLPASKADSMVAWWRQVIDVLQSASHSDDFYQKATQALVQLVGLDVGAVFVFEGDRWVPRATLARGSHSSRPSTSVLATVRESGKPFVQRVANSSDVFSSMATIDAVVAAPILDRRGDVIGALYGHRSREEAKGGEPEISHLEVLLVEALASGVATGLSRLEEQRQKLEEQRLKKAQQATFEQFFGKELAVELERDPDMLRGRETDVTVLFCDIRGFSAVSEKLTPVKTMEWIYDILSELSEEVVGEGGVVVDYVGDELLAMWGAPTSQPDHAVRACTAARRMARKMRSISDRWQGEIAAETSVGIGINTARACVGNTGSTLKFKYGPLGSGVNLGSRVQGATKYLKAPTVVTGATRRLLDDSFHLRRLCSVRVVNIVEPVELFELDCTGEPARRELFTGYEEALAAFDAGDFRRTTRILGNLLETFPGDGPALVLLSRAVGFMVNEPRDFSPVWQLPGK